MFTHHAVVLLAIYSGAAQYPPNTLQTSWICAHITVNSKYFTYQSTVHFILIVFSHFMFNTA
jgi:hypothetical protein